MKCERFDKLIHLFLDGKLERDKEKELKEHLSTCEKCAQKLALVKSVEGAAKRIEIEEPHQEYWDTFSSRVREKIIQREEKSFSLGLRKAFQGLFSFSPLKIKVAAGLVSVVLVFVVGKLYVDYRDQEIVPSKTVIETESYRQLDVLEGERKKGLPTEEAEQRMEAIPEKSETKRERVTPVRPEGKDFPPQGARGEREVVPTEEQLPALSKIAEEKPVPTHAPAVPIETLVGVELPLKQEPATPEVQSGGARADREVKKGATPDVVATKEETQVEGLERKPVRSTEGLSPPPISCPGPPTKGYLVDGIPVRRVEEDDTLASIDELSTTIRVWRLHIDNNPLDSGSWDGLIQMATAYYLLTKASHDTSLISEGSKLIEQYIDQVQGSTIKDDLGGMLKKIEALR